VCLHRWKLWTRNCAIWRKSRQI